MNRTVVITGASSGQGRAHAIAFGKLGWDVVVSDIHSAAQADSPLVETANLVREAGGQALPVQCDVAKSEDVETMFQAAADRFSTIDVVIANAGIMPLQADNDWEMDEADAMRCVDINLMGVWRTDRVALKYMVRQNRGRIINISSTAGLKPSGGTSPYCMSKFGVIGLTKNMAKAVSKRGITVNAVCPTMVKTPMMDRPEFVAMQSKALGREFQSFQELDDFLKPKRAMGIAFIDSEDVSELCVFLGTSKAAAILTGGAYAIDAGSML